MASVGSLVLKLDKAGKKRPFVCIHVFQNKAKIPYNWLFIPVTSKGTIGDDNLVKIKHMVLRNPVYAKINNMVIFNEDEVEDSEEVKYKIKKKYIRLIINKIIKTLSKDGNIERPNDSSEGND